MNWRVVVMAILLGLVLLDAHIADEYVTALAACSTSYLLFGNRKAKT